MKSPAIPKELVSWLNEVFPNRVPSGATSQRELGVKQGERRVIDKIESEYRRQTEDLPEILE